jgi:hypothetical protein
VALPPDRERSPARSSHKHERTPRFIPRCLCFRTRCEPGTARGPFLAGLLAFPKIQRQPKQASLRTGTLVAASGPRRIHCSGLGYGSDTAYIQVPGPVVAVCTRPQPAKPLWGRAFRLAPEKHGITLSEKAYAKNLSHGQHHLDCRDCVFHGLPDHRTKIEAKPI